MKNQFGRVIGDTVDWQSSVMPVPKEIQGNFCTLLPLKYQQMPVFNLNSTIPIGFQGVG